MVNQDFPDQILTFVVTSGIWDEYRASDASLDSLIALISETPGIWKDRTDIVISPQPSLVTPQYENIWRRRLKLIPNEPEYEHLRRATTQLVKYCVSHPNASVWGVTFNCSTQSYDVFCGQIDERLDFICINVGKHIPEYAMR